MLCKSAGIWWSCGGTAAQVGFFTFATQSFFCIFKFSFYFFMWEGGWQASFGLGFAAGWPSHVVRQQLYDNKTVKRCVGLHHHHKNHQNQQTRLLQQSQQTAPPSHRTQTFIITVTSGFLILAGFLLSLIKCWHFSSLIFCRNQVRTDVSFFCLPVCEPIGLSLILCPFMRCCAFLSSLTA